MKKTTKYWVKSGFPILFLLILFIFSANGCKSATGAPEDHNVRKGGIMHKEGLFAPETNCVSCHGADLNGSGTVLSCFSCHDKKW